MGGVREPRACPKPKPDCDCPEHYEPVCNEDGKEFSNECTARCAGVREPRACPKPKPSCICPEIHLPVCDKHGNRYSNECMAWGDGDAPVPKPSSRSWQLNPNYSNTTHIVTFAF